MGNFTILVKDVKEFAKTARCIYALGKCKKFSVLLHAGPNVKRYIVEVDGIETGFTKVGDAVKFFNAS